MVYVFVNYNYSADFNTPESWIERTYGYTGLLECLSKNNTVISVKQINYEGIYHHNGVAHHFVNLNRAKTYFPYKLNSYVRSLKPDIIFMQGLHQPLQLLQLRALFNNKIRIIAQHHAEIPFVGVKKYAQKLADHFVDAYLFTSKPMGFDWVNKGNLTSPNKIHEVMEVSTNFYPFNKESAKIKTGVNGAPTFLWVGRLNVNKDPLTVVKAFLKFVVENKEARLHMIYQTVELLDEVKQCLNSSPNGDRIVLIGKIAHNDLLYWFNSADFLISASHYEGGGTVVCEAIACGCVPIVTAIDAFKVVTDNGNCGIFFEVANERSLLDALRQTEILNLNEKKQQCFDYFKSNLSFEAIASRIQEVAKGL